MMVKHLKKFLVVPILFLGLATFTQAGSPEPADELVCNSCEEPPPTNFRATVITSTSIALAWDLTSSPITYKLEGWDLTTSIQLPTAYTQLGTYTFAGLTPGHDYLFHISASSCGQNGPFGTEASWQGTTGIIVTDIVLEAPAPGGFDGTVGVNAGNNFYICVKESPASPPQVSNVFFGKITYSNESFQFGMALSDHDVFIHAVPVVESSPFELYTVELSGVKYARLRYIPTNTLIFQTSYIEETVSPNYNSTAFLGFHFWPACTLQYTPGNNFNCLAPGNRSQLVSNQPLPSIAPNPFTDRTQIHFDLSGSGPVTLGLYDPAGGLVRTLLDTPWQDAGPCEVAVQGAGLPNGLYFLVLQSERDRRVFPLIKQE